MKNASLKPRLSILPILIVGGIGSTLIIAGLVTAVYHFAVNPVKVEKGTETEVRGLVRYEDLATEFDLPLPPPITVEAKRKTMAFGTWSISYDYKQDDLNIYHFIDFESSVNDSKQLYQMLIQNFGENLTKEGNVQLIEQRGWIDFGDEHKIAHVRIAGSNTGMLLNHRDGKYNALISIQGVEVTKEVFDRLIAPKLKAMPTLLDH